jgi:branched-chain amino acid transport system permease protein
VNSPDRSTARTVLSNLRTPLSKVRHAWWGVAGLALVTIFFTTTQSAYSLYIFNTVLLTCMGAIALQVMQGTAGLASVATAAYLLFGAFGSVFFLRAGVPFPGDLVLSTLLCGVIGLIAALPSLRLRSLFLALASLPLQFLAVFAGTQYENAVPSAQAAGFYVPVLFSSHGVLEGARDWAWLLFPIVSILILVSTRLIRERTGRAMRMLREHELIAPTLGISVPRMKLTILTIAAMVAGLQGALLAHFSGSIVTDDFPTLLAFQYVIMVIVGGRDSIAGAVIGAAIIVGLPIVVPNILSPFVGTTQAGVYGPNAALIIYGILVIIFVSASPDGIVGLLRKAGLAAGSRIGFTSQNGNSLPGVKDVVTHRDGGSVEAVDV